MKIKRMRYSRKRIFIGLFLFLVLAGLTFGYAFVTTKLSIEGVARVKDAKWDIHFDNYEATTGSVAPISDPTITNTNISFSAKLNDPNNFFGFTVDVENEGTINAELSSITITPDFSGIPYIDYTVTYSDGRPIVIGDILRAGKSKKIKVNLSYVDGLDESLYPTTDQTYNISIGLNYVQYTQKLVSFSDDSWDDIVENIENDPTVYEVGETKTIEMDLEEDGVDETYTLRVANNTTPQECSTTGFSQTACGFVIEFADIITLHRMNPYTDGSTNGDGNKGGWEYSDMRAYLNSTTYAYENIDYSTSGIYNALPSELRSKIIDTTVVSGHGSSDTTNFTTTDKLYLFSPHEIWDDVDGNISNGIDYYDKSYSNTRQLDYYRAKGVTTSNYADAIKKRIDNGNNYYWWLRSAISSNDYYFFFVTGNGSWYYYLSNYARGVSPAFRIA